MTNLIPEMRIDKNGVAVTRWIKKDISGSSRKEIPTVTGSPSDLLAQELSRYLSVDLIDFGLHKSELVDKARSVPPRTASALLDLRSNNFDQYTIDCIIASALHNDATPDMMENIALVYNESQYAEMDWAHEKHSAYGYITDNIRGLSQYPQYAGITNFTQHGEEVKIQAKTLTKLIYEGEGHSQVVRTKATPDGDALYFLNPDFVQLTIGNCTTDEQSDAFLDLVYEKGCDPDVLKEVLNTTTPLREGVL